MRLRFKNSKILAVLVTALFLCSLFPGYGFAEESGDPSQPIVTEYQLPGQENPDGITDGNPQDNPEGTEGDDPQSPGGNPEGTEGDDPQNNPGENPEGTEGADPQDNPGDDPEGTEGADPQDNPGENPEGTPGNNLLAGIPDVSVLVLKHVVQTLDGQTIEKVVEIPDVALGSVIAGIDYSVQDLPEGLIFTGSIPEFLAIQAGDNQIILNYQELPLPEGQVPEEIKESPGQLGEDEMEPYFSDVWLDFSPVSNNKTQQSMRMAAPSNRAFSLSTLSSQPLAPGEVKASKDAEWHDYDNRIAWIKLSVQGQPVAIGADVVLVVDNSGSMAGSDGKVRDCSGQLINPVKTGTDSWSTGIFGSKQWESETYQGVCSECGKTVEYTITRSRVWAFGWGSWSDWSTPNTNHSIYRIDIAKQAAASFVGTVLGDDNPNGNQVALVPFSSSDYGNHLNGVGFQDSVAGLTDSINAMYAEGGTNYTQALALAKTYIDGRSDQDRPAYVVFVSDGAPGKSGNSPNDPNWNGIYQANQLKNAGVTIYSVGIALSQSNAQALTALATVENGSPLYQNVQNINDLSSVLTKIAGSIKNAGTEALLTDEINTEYFDLLSGTAEYPLPAGVTVESGGIVQWNIGAITADLKEIVLYVKLKDAYANVGNLYDTNSDVYLSYTNADGEDAQKTKQEIGDPNVVVEAVVYTVTFQAGANGSLTGTTSYPNILEGTTWATAVPTVPTPVPDAGYSFTGWTPYFPATVTENATYTANFAEDADVTINYEAATGGSVSLASEDVAPATGTAEGSTATAAAGYSFVNWTDEDDNVVGTDAEFTPAKNSAGVYEAATYTANFAEDADVTINYAAATGGSVSLASETLAPATGVAQGSTATAAAGYHFVNWTKDGVEVSTDATFVPAKVSGLNVAATYIANFVPVYNVIYHANGGTGYPSDDTNYHEGEWVDVISGVNRESYAFAGWNTQADGSGDHYMQWGGFYMPAHNVNLYAQWTQAVDDQYRTAKNTLLEVAAPGVLSNDGYVPFEYLSVGKLTDTEHGTLSFNPDGSFTYEPENGFVGTDSFFYEISAMQPMVYSLEGDNGDNGMEEEWDNPDDPLIAKVTITVYGNAPVAANDSYNTNRNATLTIAAPGILANDSDAEGDSLAAVLVNSTSNGTLTLNADGSFTYVPNSNYVGTDSFTYKANDGIDDSNTATVTINVRRPSGGGGGGGGGTTTEEIVVEPEATLVPLNTEDHFAYMAGYPDNTLRPEGKVTREEVAAVFFRLLDDTYRATVKTDVNNFSDVATDRWSNTQISTLAAVGIITGYPDGTFRPGNTITRAELATIASKFDELSPFEANNFSDIAGHWANQYINSASQKGWVSGYEDGTFKPEQAITRAEFMTLVNNVLGRKVLEENILPEAKQFPDLSSDAWYYEAAQEAINSHYYERENPTDYEVWTELYDTNIDL